MTVYKYALQVTDEQQITVPSGALVDPRHQERERITIYTHGTGNPIELAHCKSYVGTYQLEDGFLVFHIFS